MADTSGPTAADAYGVNAGLNLVSGVFGYLTSLSAQSLAQSRADLIRMESEANAQRYAEQAAQFHAHEKVMYLASGVKLAGSPIDALATSARVASENIDAIRAAGDREALSQDQAGINAEMQGRNALLGGIAGAAKSITNMGSSPSPSAPGSVSGYGSGDKLSLAGPSAYGLMGLLG